VQDGASRETPTVAATNPAAPVSFSFTRTLGRKRLLPGPAQDGSRTKEEPDFLSAVEGKELRSVRPAPQAKELVIPLIQKNQWKQIDGPAAPQPPEGDDGVESQAVREIIEGENPGVRLLLPCYPLAPPPSPPREPRGPAPALLPTSPTPPLPENPGRGKAPDPIPRRPPEPAGPRSEPAPPRGERPRIPFPDIEGVDPDNARAMVKLAIGGKIVTLSQHGLRPVTRKEYDKQAKDLSKSRVGGGSLTVLLFIYIVSAAGPCPKGITEAMLETIIPRKDSDWIMVVLGENAGRVGRILRRDKDRSQALVQLQREEEGRLLTLDYDAVCHYVGGTEDD
uniref:G-patch domain and KOW motifs-containing protein n=1 Tax=Sphenodon punctatus TaxID=8508 RepID=A0A8D0L7F5_SPHPU